MKAEIIRWITAPTTALSLPIIEAIIFSMPIMAMSTPKTMPPAIPATAPFQAWVTTGEADWVVDDM
ncbi:hypothetical protein GCM10009800_34410 [Nocardiopsis rhodophaea]